MACCVDADLSIRTVADVEPESTAWCRASIGRSELNRVIAIMCTFGIFLNV